MAIAKQVILIAGMCSIIGSAAVAGLLFAFSTFVMKALAQQGPENGMRTMQSINILILNPLFLILFFGTALTLAILGVVAFFNLQAPGMSYLLIGSLLYIVLVIGTTIALNVPLNNALSERNPENAESVMYWEQYLTDWVKWNHLRTISAFLASASLMLAIPLLSR
jgi:uncharacterized membrane protein